MSGLATAWGMASGCVVWTTSEWLHDNSLTPHRSTEVHLASGSGRILIIESSQLVTGIITAWSRAVALDSFEQPHTVYAQRVSREQENFKPSCLCYVRIHSRPIFTGIPHKAPGRLLDALLDLHLAVLLNRLDVLMLLERCDGVIGERHPIFYRQ